MMQIFLEAPFASFRTFTAGWYRPTATFLTPSAAYGLLMNVAGIETRLREGSDGHNGKTPASLIRYGLPTARIAIGLPTFHFQGRCKVNRADTVVFPRVQSVFQQLHNYPVGASGKERADECKGNKYNITPVRREYLSNLCAVIAAQTDPETENRIREGLDGRLSSSRYGVPFLGDNAFLIDRLQVLNECGPVHWYEKVTANDGGGPRERTTRLTIMIDRADLSKTTSALFAPGDPLLEPPESAWVEIKFPDPPAPPSPAAPKRPRSKAS